MGSGWSSLTILFKFQSLIRQSSEDVAIIF